MLWLERAAACTKVHEDVSRLIYLYLGEHELTFFGIPLLGCPCLLRGSLAYMISGLLLGCNM